MDLIKRFSRWRVGVLEVIKQCVPKFSHPQQRPPVLGANMEGYESLNDRWHELLQSPIKHPSAFGGTTPTAAFVTEDQDAHSMRARQRRSYPARFFVRFLVFAAFFSIRTPLNFFAAFFLVGRFSAMNSPDALLRLVQADAPPIVVLVCERFFTAPLRALSPVGLLTATVHLP